MVGRARPMRMGPPESVPTKGGHLADMEETSPSGQVFIALVGPSAPPSPMPRLYCGLWCDRTPAGRAIDARGSLLLAGCLCRKLRERGLEQSAKLSRREIPGHGLGDYSLEIATIQYSIIR
jgi:hypothetical protein